MTSLETAYMTGLPSVISEDFSLGNLINTDWNYCSKYNTNAKKKIKNNTNHGIVANYQYVNLISFLKCSIFNRNLHLWKCFYSLQFCK